MQIRSVWISNYKNLQDFSLKLDKDNFLDVFRWKEWVGKVQFIGSPDPYF